jgi:hypothetical protein
MRQAVAAGGLDYIHIILGQSYPLEPVGSLQTANDTGAAFPQAGYVRAMAIDPRACRDHEGTGTS